MKYTSTGFFFIYKLLKTWYNSVMRPLDWLKYRWAALLGYVCVTLSTLYVELPGYYLHGWRTMSVFAGVLLILAALASCHVAVTYGGNKLTRFITSLEIPALQTLAGTILVQTLVYVYEERFARVFLSLAIFWFLLEQLSLIYKVRKSSDSGADQHLADSTR